MGDLEEIIWSPLFLTPLFNRYRKFFSFRNRLRSSELFQMIQRVATLDKVS